MVELPLDDAATAYEKVAQALEDVRWTMDISDLKGKSAETMSATIESFNAFTSEASARLADHVGNVQNQHAADEDLRDNPKPSEVRELEAQAERIERLAKSSTGLSTAPMIMAAQARAKADDARQRRDAAFARHDSSSAQNAPKLLVMPPALTGVSTAWNDGYAPSNSGGGTDGHDGGSRVLPQTGGGSGSSMDSGSSSLPSASSGGSGGSLGGSSVDASDVGTETSSDGMMGAGGAQTPMMSQPQAAQAQQPQMPSMGGTGATGTPQSGMLGGAGSTTGTGARNRRDRRNEPNTDLSGAGVVAGGVAGAVGAAGAAGIDRGASVSGVNTKADTSGLGTNLSGASGKPGGGAAAPTGNMMRGGGMMGGMGAMGSGAQQANSKEKPDIKPLIKDRDLNGLDSLKDAIDGGIIGRSTSEAPDETGIDRFLDPDKIKKD